MLIAKIKNIIYY